MGDEAFLEARIIQLCNHIFSDLGARSDRAVDVSTGVLTICAEIRGCACVTDA